MNPFGELIGESAGIVKIREQAERLLKRQAGGVRLPGILIQGETGTGKGLLALLLHRASARARGPFVQLNCAAIPDNLMETELFGNVKGAYTDAREAKPGLFQAADHGTLFLDEIGSLRKDHQAKLLTAIEDRVVRRVGATRTEAVDVWVLAACNSDLAADAHVGEFREDLYYRLAGVTLTLPPLREREGDAPEPVVEVFLERTCAEHKLGTRTLADDARAALLAYRWKGNVRQLASKIESAATFSDESVVTADMLDLADSESLRLTPTEALVQEERVLSHEEAMGEVERERLLAALRQTNWNVTHAAERLGVSRDTLRGRMKKYDLRPDGSSPVARRRFVRAGSAPALPPAGTVPLRWEPRRVTLLRAVLVASPGADPQVRGSRALEAFVEKVESFGGRVEEAGPTGIVGAFGVEPVEDAARRAAHAAMAIQKAAERAPQETDVELSVKLAIHGDQFLVSQGGGPAQLDLDGKRQAWTTLEALLSRIQPGQIVVNESIVAFLTRHFDLVPVESEMRG